MLRSLALAGVAALAVLLVLDDDVDPLRAGARDIGQVLREPIASQFDWSVELGPGDRVRLADGRAGEVLALDENGADLDVAGERVHSARSQISERLAPRALWQELAFGPAVEEHEDGRRELLLKGSRIFHVEGLESDILLHREVQLSVMRELRSILAEHDIAVEVREGLRDGTRAPTLVATVSATELELEVVYDDDEFVQNWSVSAHSPWEAPRRLGLLGPLAAIFLALATRRPVAALALGAIVGAVAAREAPDVGVGLGASLALLWAVAVALAIVAQRLAAVVAGRARISREKIAWTLDSFAAPLAGLMLVSVSAVLMRAHLAPHLPAIGRSPEDAFAVALEVLPYRFYGWFTLVFLAVAVSTRRDFGPMLGAERRARAGRPMRDGARPLGVTGGAGWPAAVRAAAVPVVLIALGWTMAETCRASGANAYLASTLDGAYGQMALPFLIFAIATSLALVTGRAASVLGLLPLVVDTAYTFGANGGAPVVVASLAALLEGAAFGAHISPLAPSTILSSTAAGCDHVDHVATQTPYALVCVGAALVFGFGAAVVVGLSPWIGLLLGGAAVGVIAARGVRAEAPEVGGTAAAPATAEIERAVA